MMDGKAWILPRRRYTMGPLEQDRTALNLGLGLGLELGIGLLLEFMLWLLIDLGLG